MSYSILGQNLHDTADKAKQYFAKIYGARKFECEQPIDNDLPLKPTWQGTLNAGYVVCIEVRETPFSNSLYEFVSRCATRGMPVRLWVAVPQAAAGPTFNSELKQAREAGVGVVQIGEDGGGHEFHRAVSLSLFALKKTDLNSVPKGQREEVKTAEATFLDGTPEQGCQAICQGLEQLTRAFAEHTFNQGWWRQGKATGKAFFQKDAWATMLEEMEDRLEVTKVKAICTTFAKQMIVRTRGQTDWRNAVSHKPKNLRELQLRDARLRTMFEVTRDLLMEWYAVAKPLKLIK